MKLNKDIPFTVAPNALIQDENISPQARFLYVYMASMPDDWDFYMNPLAKKMQMTVKTLRKYMGELEQCGWLTNHGQQNTNGAFGANEYTIHSTTVGQKLPYGKKSVTQKERNAKNDLQTKETSIQKKHNNNNTVEKTSFSDDVCVIVEFLNEQTESKYRPTTKKTRDCIKARMNEGFVLDEFKTVIRHKTKEWLGTDSEQWLRPETLFGNKFEGYLNDAIRKQSKARKEVNGAIVDENGNIKLKTIKKHASNAELEKERAHMARLRELQRQVYGV